MTLRVAIEGRGPVLLVGLTGGIATGKSTVAGILREMGAPVVDADAIVHGLLEPGGAAVEPVVAAFGDAVRGEDGGVDRPALARTIFRDEAARRRLEAIVHPLVVTESRARIAQAASSGDADVVFYDAALLVETRRHHEFDRLVVVATTPELQIERLCARDGLDVDDAGARIRSQLPIRAKVGLADYVIDNSGHWTETRRQVAEMLRLLREDAAALRENRPLAARRAKQEDE